MARAGYQTQADLAVACGVTQTTVSALLTGRRPGLSLLRKIAEKTGVAIEWLRWGDGDKAPPWWATSDETARRVAAPSTPYDASAAVVAAPPGHLVSPVTGRAVPAGAITLVEEAVILHRLNETVHAIIDGGEQLLAQLNERASMLGGAGGVQLRQRPAWSRSLERLARTTEELRQAYVAAQDAVPAASSRDPVRATTARQRRPRTA